LLVEEFFCARDVQGMIASVAALGCTCFHDELAALLLRAALDRQEQERQAAVGLLSALEAEGLLSNAQLVRGFEKLVLAWDDLQLDVPGAPCLLVALLSSRVGLLDRSLFARLPEELLRELCSSLPPGPARDTLEAHLGDLAAFKVELRARLDSELFCRRSVDDFAAWLKGAGKPAFHHEVLIAACLSSFGAEPSASAFWTACCDAEGLAAEKRSLVLAMLRQLHTAQEAWLLDEVDVQLGFSRLLGGIEALERERPGTTEMLTGLLGGAVEQEVLPAEFLRSARRMRFGGPCGVEVVRAAQRRTPMHSRRIWGSGDARQFRKEVKEAILEYFDSGSLDELAQIVEELHLSEKEQAHFVQKLLVAGMERGEASGALDAVQALMGSCWSAQEVQAAFEELRDIARDLVLDFPHCREHTSDLVRTAVGRGVLDQSYLVYDVTTVV